MRSPVEATTYRDPDSKQHLYAVKTKLVEQTYHGNPHRARVVREPDGRRIAGRIRDGGINRPGDNRIHSGKGFARVGHGFSG